MSKKINIPPKKELEMIYLQYGETISSLARKYNTSNPTIRSWLKKYNIPLKDHKQASTESNKNNKTKIPDIIHLNQDYQHLSLKELQKKYKIGQKTLYNWLKYYNINLRTLSDSIKNYKEKYKNFLLSKNNINHKTLKEIYSKYKNKKNVSIYFGLSNSFLKKYYKEYNISTLLNYRSSKEIELFEYCKNTFKEYNWENNNKNLIPPYEIDIVCHDIKLAIEYCGLYWHSEITGKKDKTYHKLKYDRCRELGYELLTIFETDNIEKVKNLIHHKLKSNKKIFARKCIIKQIDKKEAKKFHELYHMHNSIHASVHYGLYFNNELVQVSSFSKSRFNKKYEWECARNTLKSGCSIIGGTSKLFKHFINDYKVNSIITYADRRYGSGSVYLKCGFKELKSSPPNYWYFKNNILYSRVKFQKHKLKNLLEFYDDKLTEWECMKLNKWDRIWDCGNSVFIFTK